MRDELDCEFTQWSTWTACSTDCGTGVQGRTRTLITPAYCGGNCENEATEEELECEDYEAKQDCEVSRLHNQIVAHVTCIFILRLGVPESIRLSMMV